MEPYYPICGTIASTIAHMSAKSSNTGTKSKEWGNWLRRQIVLSGLSRQQFANKAKVAKSTVSRWISGDRPSAKQIERIADALVMDPETVMRAVGYLDLDLEIDPNSPTARLMPLIEKVNWDDYPERLHTLEMELRFMIETDRKKMAISEEE